MISNYRKQTLIKKSNQYLLSIGLFIMTSIFSIYIANNTMKLGYEKLYLLPFLYGIMFFFFLGPILFNSYKNKYLFVFILTFNIFSFIRYVILPLLIVYTNFYGGLSVVSPSPDSFNSALLLMIYELIILSLFMFILFKININKLKESSIEIPNKNFVYLLFILISMLIIIIYPNILNSFYFITPSEDLNYYKDSTISNMLTYTVFLSKNIIYLVTMSYLYRFYKINKNIKYVIISFILSQLNILIVFGTNRFDFLIVATVTFITFVKLYPKYAKIASIIMLASTLLITSLITTYRDYQSYTEGSDKLVDLTNTIQVYTGGPYNVAIAIEAKEKSQNEINKTDIFYEFLRPTLGLNVFMKNFDVQMSTDYFNERIFFSNNRSQIIPIIGQGYFYFGFLLAPSIMIMFLFLAFYLIKKLNNTPRIELQYFLTIPLLRIALAMGLNGVILMNILSYFLTLSLILYYFNNKIILKKS